jgi:hypothetical protein
MSDWQTGHDTEWLMLRSCLNTPKQLETVFATSEFSWRHRSPDICRGHGRRRPEWRHHRQFWQSTVESGAAASWRRPTTPKFWLCSAAEGYCAFIVRHHLHIQRSVATVDVLQMVRRHCTFVYRWHKDVGGVHATWSDAVDQQCKVEKESVWGPTLQELQKAHIS